MRGTRVSASETGKGSGPPVEELATDPRKLPLRDKGEKITQSPAGLVPTKRRNQHPYRDVRRLML